MIWGAGPNRSSFGITTREDYDITVNNGERWIELDLENGNCWALEEMQGKMYIAKTHYYNRWELAHHLFVGIMVRRRNEFAHQNKFKKLSPKWVGSYKVLAIAHTQIPMLWKTYKERTQEYIQCWAVEKIQHLIRWHVTCKSLMV